LLLLPNTPFPLSSFSFWDFIAADIFVPSSSTFSLAAAELRAKRGVILFPNVSALANAKSIYEKPLVFFGQFFDVQCPRCMRTFLDKGAFNHNRLRQLLAMDKQ
jgi:hypothetical protein